MRAREKLKEAQYTSSVDSHDETQSVQRITRKRRYVVGTASLSYPVHVSNSCQLVAVGLMS